MFEIFSASSVLPTAGLSKCSKFAVGKIESQEPWKLKKNGIVEIHNNICEC